MRSRLIGVVSAVLVVCGSALAPSALAGGSLQVTMDYSGVYTFQEATSNGKGTDTVAQTFGWLLRVQGDARPPGEETLLPVHLEVAGSSTSVSSGQLGTAPGTVSCTYDPGTGTNSTLGFTDLLTDVPGVSYGTGIPGAVPTCNGQRGGLQDVLACDSTGCATACASSDPRAVTTDRFKVPVVTAFRPTTQYMSAGVVPFDDKTGNFWGTVTTQYDLPSDEGVVAGGCNGLTETGQMTITSQVTYTVLDTRTGFSIDFPDATFPEVAHPIDVLDYPGGPYAPYIFVPPATAQPPEVTIPPPAVDSAPVVGLIEIQCPRRDVTCRGTATVTGARASRAVLGARRYRVAGGRRTLMAIALAPRIRTALEQAGSVTVSLRIDSVTAPGARHFQATRRVKLIEYRPITGAPGL